MHFDALDIFVLFFLLAGIIAIWAYFRGWFKGHY